MKKLLLFIPIVLMLNSCGPSLYNQDLIQSGYADADRWIERTIPPSQISTLGDMFFEEKLSRGGSFSVGGLIDEDSTYWYNTFMQDSGWRTNQKDGWTSIGTNYTRIKKGYLYINLKKQVAVYISESGYYSFRVTINPE
tara:strand:- start:5223 stop:5639 length:417 start_codon:yes stop_codon:yes gene_type:complete